MPHLVVTGPLTPEDIWLAFEPTEFVEKGMRFKAEEAFLSHDKTNLLIRSLTVERGFKKVFYVRITSKGEGSITLGLDQLNRPEVSEGVKRLLGLYAWKILQVEPESHVTGGNIQDYLGEPQG
jgi:hypothetical protein